MEFHETILKPQLVCPQSMYLQSFIKIGGGLLDLLLGYIWQKFRESNGFTKQINKELI